MDEELILLTTQLKVARGKEFVKLLKQTYYAIAPLLEKRANQMIEAEGKLTARMVGVLANEFNLCAKHTFEFLAHLKILPSGTYDRLIDRGLKVRDILRK